MLMEKQFAVITADIVGSRKGIPGNPDDNSKSLLDRNISIVNERLLELGIRTITPFHSSRGDEVQCVCGKLGNIPVLTRYLRYYCLPFKLRVGIGLGEIDYFSLDSLNDMEAEVAITSNVSLMQDNKAEAHDKEKINLFDKSRDIPEKHIQYNDYNEIRPLLEKNYTKLNSWDMNGNAFYYARRAIDNLKQGREHSRTCIHMKDNNWTIAIQTIFDLMDAITIEWSESKWKSVQMYDEHGTYEKAARILDLTKQAVQGNCERARWTVVKAAENNLSKIFELMDMISAKY
ncbi:MAG: hypothetical protein Q8930_16630 [Bacillota bacterium]|nr:hypothetical protein [Bacillota bacterium]